MIPITKLKKGTVYKLNSRNLNLGVYNGRHGFVGIRTKFGNRFLDEEMEHSTDDHYGTATAQSELGVIPEAMSLELSLGTECKACHQLVNFDISRTEKERWHHADNSVMCAGMPTSIDNKELFEELEKYEQNLQNH